MRYGSVCSGIEAATVAWHPLGWQPAFFSEIEAAPKAVLAHHWPDVPCHGDFTTIRGDEYGPIDLLVGGTPCQDFSIAGLRAGLGGDRGNLSLEFLRLADRTRPRWVVWENVPGVLSIDRGKAFGAILGGLGELGYGFAYRVLDAQHFGVPQRRRRVFVVGCLGDWRGAGAVLSERHSLSGHPAPRRGQGQSVAGCLSPGTHPGGFNGQDAYTGQLIAFSAKDHGADAGDVAPTLRAGGHAKSHANAGVMPAVAFSIMPMNSGKDYVARQVNVAQPLMAGGPVGGNQGGDFIVPINPNALRGDSCALTPSPDAEGRVRLRDPGLGVGANGDPADTLQAAGPGAVATPTAVRRLTPRECERLQGFPDDYTLVPHRGKPMADGPRYKALGNSMAVPVMAFIGRRIQMVDDILENRDAA